MTPALQIFLGLIFSVVVAAARAALLEIDFYKEYTAYGVYIKFIRNIIRYIELNDPSARNVYGWS